MSVKLRYVGSAPGFNPHVGDVEPGSVYPVPDPLVPQFERSDDWEPEKPKSDASGRPKTNRKA